MTELTFKTNINCSNCVARVTNSLNTVAGEGNWRVDTDNPDKTLVVVTNGDLTPEAVIKAIKKTGFVAEAQPAD